MVVAEINMMRAMIATGKAGSFKRGAVGQQWVGNSE